MVKIYTKREEKQQKGLTGATCTQSRAITTNYNKKLHHKEQIPQNRTHIISVEFLTLTSQKSTLDIINSTTTSTLFLEPWKVQ